jgi:hypothetical protein
MHTRINANNAYSRSIRSMGKEVRTYRNGIYAVRWVVHRGRMFRKLARIHTVDKMRDGNVMCRLCNHQ